MIYPKSVEVIEKIPTLSSEEYVYDMKSLGKVKRVVGKYTSVEEAIKNKAFKEYTEVIFTTRKTGSYTQYRCLFDKESTAKKAQKEVYKLWKFNQERLVKKKLSSSSFVIVDNDI